MINLNPEEIKNLLVLITRPETTIKANEAVGVALLQQKLQKMLTPEPEEKTEEK